MSYKYNYYFLPIKFLILFQLINLLSFVIKDIDYALKLRLNNGNYLMLAAQGIYMYNQNLTSKIDVNIFDTRLTNEHCENYPTNLAQFLSEDGGYVICLIKNMTFIVSKNGEYLTEYSLDYMRNKSSFPIIPYGHSGTQYYYLIITIEDRSIKFRKYIYNSYSKIIQINKLSLACMEKIKMFIGKFLILQILLLYQEWRENLTQLVVNILNLLL